MIIKIISIEECDKKNPKIQSIVESMIN